MSDVARPEPLPASDQYVQSLARGLSVIRAFDVNHQAMTLSEVAARTDLTRATARRFLSTLVQLGYMRTDGKRFTLTAEVLALGYSYLSALSLPQVAQPHLERLSGRLGESSSLTVLEAADIVYVARVATRRIMNIDIAVGTRFPAYATSMGRVLLAHLPAATLEDYLATVQFVPHTSRALASRVELGAVLDQVRRQGWCVLDQELELGVMSVAAPVKNAAGQVVAAVNVSFQALAVAAHPDAAGHLATIRAEVVATARVISTDMAAQRT